MVKLCLFFIFDIYTLLSPFTKTPMLPINLTDVAVQSSNVSFVTLRLNHNFPSIAASDNALTQVAQPKLAQKISMLLANGNSQFRLALAVFGVLLALIICLFFWYLRLKFIQKHLLFQRGVISRKIESQKLALHKANVGVWELDLTTNQIYWDEQVAKIHGWAFESKVLSLNSWLQMLHEDERAPFELAMLQAGRSEKEFCVDYQTVTPSGLIKHCRVCGASAYSGEGQRDSLVGTVIDLSENIEKEAEIEEAITHAEQTFAAKSAFMLTFCHGMKSPIHNILCIANIMQLTSLQGSQRAYLSMLKSSAEKLIRFLSTMTSFSKESEGRIGISYDGSCVNELVARSSQQLKYTSQYLAKLRDSNQ
ncbi:PAS domain-containing protein [Agaribacter flavus]|uniref:histidine kinase n=1 Tax=Agaribacter flavus TaxID=1902781 RepID=A0ABV7FME2_9ALTE